MRTLVTPRRMTGSMSPLRSWIAVMGVASALTASIGAMYRIVQAAAPPGHYTLGIGAEAGTVLDNQTGLRWQREPGGTFTFNDAAAYCQTSTLGGLSGWRVPSATEAQTLVDETVVEGVDTSVFSVSGQIWTSTLAGSSGEILDPAGDVRLLELSSAASVRCVRTENQ
jgi:hypothetical protein